MVILRTREDGRTILLGMLSETDQHKKYLCVFESVEKAAAFIDTQELDEDWDLVSNPYESYTTIYNFKNRFDGAVINPLVNEGAAYTATIDNMVGYFASLN